MKKTLLYFFLAISFLTGACNSTSKEEEAFHACMRPAFHSHIYLPVTISDSIRGQFVFDTGATGFYLDSLFYAENFSSQAYPLGKALLQGAGVEQKMTPLVAIPLAFSIDTLSGEYQSSITPLIELKEILGRKADGIVGKDFFGATAGKYLAIDYLHGRFAVASTLPDTSGYRRIALELHNGQLFLHTRISISGKQIEGPFLLDTGCGGSIILTRSTAQQYALEQLPCEKARYRFYPGGIGGYSEQTNLLAQEAVLDTFRLKDLSVAYSSDTAGALSSRDYLGLIGNKILNRFDVILDLKDNYLYLRPNAYYAQPYENYGSGLLCTDRTDICEGVVITGLRVESAAEEAGVMLGDVLLAIDTTQVKHLSEEQIEHLLQDTTRASVVLSLQRNGQSLKRSIKPERGL